MGASSSKIKKVNFEDLQEIQYSNNSILINTLLANEQNCLIRKTINFNDEETIINNLLNGKTNAKIFIYGKNTNDETIYKKYNQLLQLGFQEIYVYPGGLFEWLCLQDIYGEESFPTTKKELDILKYKPHSHLNVKYLENR